MEIGIDIGTSYSSVAVLGENGPLPVKCDTGQCAYGNSYSIPSAVFAKKDGTLLIGQAAVASRMIDPSCFRDCFKRDFGNDTAFLLGDCEYTTDQFYIEFFKHFKAVSESLSGKAITKAYITHPADYTDYKKGKLKTTAAYAGLLDIQLIDEPTAAALSYFGKESIPEGERLLIYDFGGGTLDLALVKATKEGFEPLTSPLGLMHCGGTDFDMMIYDDILTALSETNDLSSVMNNMKFRAMISEQSIKIKHMLSYDTTATVSIPFGFDFLNYTIDRSRYNRMITQQVIQSCNLVRRITENAGIRLSDIDRTLCVGGTTRTPYVIEMLEQTTGKKAYQNADPELAICCGAATYSKMKFKPADSNEDKHSNNHQKQNLQESSSYDMRQPIYVDYQTAKNGGSIKLVHNDKNYLVNILAATKNDQMLRLKNLANPYAEDMNKRGDLYLQFIVLDPPLTTSTASLAPSFHQPIKSVQRGNTVGNIVYKAYTAYSNGWIYYNNFHAGKTLYKMRMDGSQKTKLSNDNCEYINIVDSWIYYRNASDSGKLYRMQTDGSQKIKLSDDNCVYVNVVDEWIYYSDFISEKLFKMRTDGSQKKILYDKECWFVSVIDGWIYYSDDEFDICRMLIDGSHRSKLCKINSAQGFDIVDDWIYFIDVHDTYRMKTDGSRIEMLSDSCNTICHSDGWLYYSNPKDSYALYKMRIDGSEKIKLSNDGCYYINAIDGWIFYPSTENNTELIRIRKDGSDRQILT